MSAYKSGARRSLIAEKFLSILLQHVLARVWLTNSEALLNRKYYSLKDFEFPLNWSRYVFINNTGSCFQRSLIKVNCPTLRPSEPPDCPHDASVCGVTCKCNTFGLFTQPSAVCLGRIFPACFVIIHFIHFRLKLPAEKLRGNTAEAAREIWVFYALFIKTIQRRIIFECFLTFWLCHSSRGGGSSDTQSNTGGLKRWYVWSGEYTYIQIV